MEFHSWVVPEKAFLLGVMTLMPFCRKLGYASATSCEEVLSTRTTLLGDLDRYVAMSGRERSLLSELARAEGETASYEEL